MTTVKELTPSELTKLRGIIIGHGNLRKNAVKSDIKERTLERIALTGKGLEENINKVRSSLLGASKVHTLEETNA